MFLRIAAVAMLAGSALFAGGITVGSFDDGNCYPYLCFASDGGMVYQEQFRAGAFSGPIDITQMSLFHDIYADSGAALMDPATFQVTLATSNVAFGSMGATYQDNIGADAVVFGTYHFQGTMPDVLTIVGATPFNYNPANGDLILSLLVTSDGPGACPYCTFFEADYTGTDVLRSFWSSRYGSWLNDTGAPVTNFNGNFEGAVILGDGGTLGGGAVPEPASLGLMAGGIGMVALLFRSRK